MCPTHKRTKPNKKIKPHTQFVLVLQIFLACRRSKKKKKKENKQKINKNLSAFRSLSPALSPSLSMLSSNAACLLCLICFCSYCCFYCAVKNNTIGEQMSR